MKRAFVAGFLSILLSSNVAFAAIQYGSTTQQSSLAPGATQQVGDLLNKVVSGDLASGNASNTTDISGTVSGIGSFFAGVNTWLKEKAGIDFFSILKGIGQFFLWVLQFVFDLLRKVL